jgi:hypothetical protein
MRGGIIKNGVVVNVCELPDDWNPANAKHWQPNPDETVILHPKCEIGYAVRNGMLVIPRTQPLAPKQPLTLSEKLAKLGITLAELKEALKDAGP